MRETHSTTPGERLAHALTIVYFLLVCLAGISPGKGLIVCAHVALCLSIAYTCFWERRDFSAWLTAKPRVIFFFLFQLLAWLLLIPVEWYSFEFNNYDTGIFANQILEVYRTGQYYCSILGMHAFADHFTPNLILLAPLFSIWESFLWLPILKVLAWGWSVYLLFGLSGDVLGRDSRYRYVVPGIYLLNRFVASTLLMEFQSSSLATPFVVLAFRFAYQGRMVALISVLCILLGFKEHLGVVWISIGLFLALERKQVWLGALLALCGSLEGIVIYKWVMPIFAQGAVHHDARLGPFVALGKKANLLFQALLSFGGLPLFARYGILYALPGFILVLMGGDAVMISFKHHYHDIGFALLACSSVLGLRSIRTYEGNTPRTIIACVILCILGQDIRFPTHFIRTEWPSREKLALHRDMEKLQRYLDTYNPQETWTIDHLGPYLLHYPGLHSLIKPEQPPLPQDGERRAVVVSNVVKTFPFSPEEYEKLLRYLKTNFKEVSADVVEGERLQVFVSK
jgi:uncharacterized membrane protein